MRFVLLLLVGFNLACYTHSDPSEVPWAGATFDRPLPTGITIVNASDTTLALKLSTRFLPEIATDDYPDSLGTGDSAWIELAIFRPADLFLALGSSHSLRPMLPGIPRKLIFGGGKLRNAGPGKVYYNYLDGKLMPIRPVGRQPEAFETLPALFAELEARYDTAVTEARATAPAPWLRKLVDREVRLLSLFDTYSMRDYHRFFYADTMALSAGLIDRAEILLRNDSFRNNISYDDLLHAYTRNVRSDYYDSMGSVGARNYRALTDYIIEDFPKGELRVQLAAEVVLVEQADLMMYTAKDQNLDRLRAILPAVYRDRLDTELATLVERRSDDSALQELLSTPLRRIEGPDLSPLASRRQPKTLYKFWFEGCYPCLVQQPAEADLLQKHDDLDLVYVSFNTRSANWEPYLKKHRPPTDSQLFLAKDRQPTLAAALGQIGAPTYLLLGPDNEVICRHCPKPDDPLLAELIAGIGEH